jgi:hypothetical protein
LNGGRGWSYITSINTTQEFCVDSGSQIISLTKPERSSVFLHRGPS